MGLTDSCQKYIQYVFIICRQNGETEVPHCRSNQFKILSNNCRTISGVGDTGELALRFVFFA